MVFNGIGHAKCDKAELEVSIFQENIRITAHGIVQDSKTLFPGFDPDRIRDILNLVELVGAEIFLGKIGKTVHHGTIAFFVA